MAYFPDKLYEIIKDRAGDNTRENSNTKYLLEKGGPTIIKKFIEEAGDVVGAAMEQDLDQMIKEIGDVWYYTLVICLYYGITPEQVERGLISLHKQQE